MKIGGSFGFYGRENALMLGLFSDTQVAQVLYDAGEAVKYPLSTMDLIFWRKCGLEMYVHGPMNINPCDPARRGWTYMMMKDCCKLAGEIGAKGIVVHPGSKKELEVRDALDCLYKFCQKMTQISPCPILLEVDAGSKNGNRMGSPEYLMEICDQINHPNVKICLDTTHAYARGVDLWDDVTREQLLLLLKPHLELVHLNVPDPNVGLGSFRDRHNTTFVDYPRDSSRMIKDFVSRYPVILERHDIDKQNADVQAIKLAMSNQ